MSQRKQETSQKVSAQRKGRESGSRGRRGSSAGRGSSGRPELPLSHQGRVQTSNPTVLEWLAHTSTSTRMSSETASQVSVGTSDTTLTWHGQAAIPPRPPSVVVVPKIPLTFDPPSARELLASMESELLFEDDEDVGEESETGDNQQEGIAESEVRSEQALDRPGRRAVCSRRERDVQEPDEDDSIILEQDDATSDVSWDPGHEVASSTDSSTGNPSASRPATTKKQTGSSSQKRSRKRSRDRQMTTGEPSGTAGANIGSTLPSSRPVGSRFYTSPVWKFFKKCPEDTYVVICHLCDRRIKRGKSCHPGTSAMAAHMKRHHPSAWEKRGDSGSQQAQPDPQSTAAGSGSSQGGLSLSQTSSVEGSVASLPSSAGGPCVASSRQPVIMESLYRRQTYAPSNPKAVKLNANLAKLLVLQALPFRVVDSAPFRELMLCAEPRWKVPSRHYFSNTAMPAMYSYVRQKVADSLSHSVSRHVHLTTDIWSCNYGQGQYMSITAQWVNVIWSADPQQLGQGRLMTPPRCQSRVPGSRSSSSSSSTSSSRSKASSNASGPPLYHLGVARRCHAVLHLACLGERRHTGEELHRLLETEILSWLTPRRLQVGTVVSDNGSNILSALRRGGMRHAPCMAHVLNLIVNHFLKSTSQLQTVLSMARKLCNHFSHSSRSHNILLDLQRRNGLPHHRLICDVATRWNSTLHMLDRLYEQRKALTDFLLMQADTATPLCNLELGQWQLMRDTCRLLRPFEEATLLVSGQDTGLSAIIPMLHVLELMLMRLSGEGEQVLSLSQPESLEEGLAEGEEEDLNAQELLGETGGGEGDGPSFQTRGGPEEDMQGYEEDGGGTHWQYAVETEAGTPSHSLVEMAKRMLICFRADPRLQNIRQRDDFWLATLLDPRYRNKMCEFIHPSQREERMNYYREELAAQLVTAFGTRRSHSRHSHQGHTSSAASSTSSSSSLGCVSSGSSLSLMSMMHAFMQPQAGVTGAPAQQQDMASHLKQQVQVFLESTLPPNVTEPLDYWSGKLDVWPQLAEFALDILSCPASSVSSERVFSAAGQMVSPRRTRLSCDSVERLTFIKMNATWIDKDFVTPAPDTTE